MNAKVRLKCEPSNNKDIKKTLFFKSTQTINHISQ